MINSVNVNSVNSYPNYNNYNTSLNSQTQIKNSQNTSLENKKANRSISPKETNSNLVSDVSQATSQILGYGVDKEGFFTSDFNEAAGLPKDYKINANFIKDLDKTLTTTELTSKSLYSYVDWAKELGNFYKENLQSLDSFGENFDKEQIQNELKISPKDDFTKADVLFSAFLTSDWSKMKYSESTIFGKTYGFDKNINQKDMQEFYKFMQKNQIKDPNNIEKSSFKNVLSDDWMGVDRERNKLRGFVNYAMDFKLSGDIVSKANNFVTEFDELISGDLSLDEFKTKYLDFKQRHDEFVKEFEEAMGDNLLVKPIDSKMFKPIQVESKSQTYKDTDRLNALELAKDRQLANMLEILFGFKSNNFSTPMSKNLERQYDLTTLKTQANLSLDLRV